MRAILFILAFLLLTASTGAVAGNSSQSATFTTDHFSGSGNCTRCHNGLTDSSGTDVSLETSWSDSIMRFAFVDPLWRAKVRTEIIRAPHLQAVIEDKCGRCHAPMASVEANFAGASTAIFGSGFTNPDNSYHLAAMEGISCTLCHQVQDSPYLGTDKANSGKFVIADLLPPGRPLFGPYTDLFTSSMRGSVGFTPTNASHVSSSEMCAVCHDLKTPYVNAAGEVVSTSETEFPEQMPYREWLLSSFATTGPGSISCQGCHMPVTDGVRISRSPQWLPQRDGFNRHQFRSGNSLLLEIINSNEASLGLTSLNLQQALQDGDQFIRTAAALELGSISLSQGTLDFTLKVSNLTGHKLSTGIPIRRIIVHVALTNQNGKVVFESGKVNADMSIQGCDADLDPLGFEPHYNLITSPDQVQIYEGIMGNTDGQVTYTLLRASQFLKDNRLLPAGFDKTTAPPDVATIGEATGDANFTGGSDQISYRIGGLDSGRYTLSVQLLEQKVSYGFFQDLLKDASDVEVAAYRDMLLMVQATTKSLAELTASINGQ